LGNTSSENSRERFGIVIANPAPTSENADQPQAPANRRPSGKEGVVGSSPTPGFLISPA
jgi:hypothetical protein